MAFIIHFLSFSIQFFVFFEEFFYILGSTKYLPNEILIDN